MAIYLWVQLILVVIAIVFKLLFLAVGEYPRVVKYDAWEDVLLLIIAVAFLTWTCLLLFT